MPPSSSPQKMDAASWVNAVMTFGVVAIGAGDDDAHPVAGHS